MTEMMKCVIKAAPGKGNLATTLMPIPTIGPNDILVKVKAVALCGTDLHIADWNRFASDRMTMPTIIGHEFSGEIVALGSEVHHLQIGDAIAAETHIVCHACDACLHDDFHVCSYTKTIGLSRDGALAEYIAIPAENAVVFDKSYSWEELSLMEPFVAAVHAMTAFPLLGNTIAVIGCGPIGIMGIIIAKYCGASRVIAIEPIPNRLEKAKEAGADVVINPEEVDVSLAVKEANFDNPVDVVVDFSGNVSAIAQSLDYVRPAGKMAILGLSDHELSLPLDSLVYRGITLKGIAGRRMFSDWAKGRGLLRSGLSLKPVITHVLPLDKYEEGLELMRQGTCCKCVLMVN